MLFRSVKNTGLIMLMTAVRTTSSRSPEALTRPRWFLEWAKTLRPPTLTAPNQGPRGQAGPPFFQAYGEWMGTPPPTWEDIAWLREFWGGPFMLKGVMRIDDAKRAVDAGCTAISVSNHGGNNLDGTPATIRALPAIAEAVGDQVEERRVHALPVDRRILGGPADAGA